MSEVFSHNEAGDCGRRRRNIGAGVIALALAFTATNALASIDAAVQALVFGANGSTFTEDSALSSDVNCSLTTLCSPGIHSLDALGSLNGLQVVSSDIAVVRFRVPNPSDGTTIDTGPINVQFSGTSASLPSGPSPKITRAGNGNTITSEISSFSLTFNPSTKKVTVLMSLSNLTGDGGSLSVTWRGVFTSSLATGATAGTVVEIARVLQSSLRLFQIGYQRYIGFRRMSYLDGGSDRALARDGDALTFSKVGGLAAGDGVAPWGAWGSVSYSNTEDDFATTASDTERVAFLGGADFAPWNDNVIFGLAVGFESVDTETNFNAGEVQIHGVTIAPYLAAFWGDNYSADVSFGYTASDIDQFRTQAGASVTSALESERWFASANAAYTRVVGSWVFSGRTGLLYARETVDAFVESDGTSIASSRFKLGQFNVGLEAAYSLKAGWEPFGSVTYEHDFNKTDLQVQGLNRPNDNSGFVLGLGVRYFGSGGLSGLLQVNSVLGRDDIDETSVTATLRGDF